VFSKKGIAKSFDGKLFSKTEEYLLTEKSGFYSVITKHHKGVIVRCRGLQGIHKDELFSPLKKQFIFCEKIFSNDQS
jgi:hypothetical protein